MCLTLDVYKKFCVVHNGVILVNEFKAASHLTCNKHIERLLIHVVLTLEVSFKHTIKRKLKLLPVLISNSYAICAFAVIK